MAELKEISPDAPMGAKLLNWVDNRFPASKLYNDHLGNYFAPKNFNFWYVFGALSLLVLVIQIVTGIFLTMHYKPDAALAVASVEYIMRDVPWGWLIRYMHSTGASAFFVVVYLHMFRGLMYGSYRKPRELVWLFGCAIFLEVAAGLGCEENNRREHHQEHTNRKNIMHGVVRVKGNAVERVAFGIFVGFDLNAIRVV